MRPPLWFIAVVGLNAAIRLRELSISRRNERAVPGVRAAPETYPLMVGTHVALVARAGDGPHGLRAGADGSLQVHPAPELPGGDPRVRRRPSDRGRLGKRRIALHAQCFRAGGSYSRRGATARRLARLPDRLREARALHSVGVLKGPILGSMAVGTGTLTVIEPATEKVLAELKEASVEDADRAVERAKAAFPAWKSVSPKDRAAAMRRIAAAIDKHREELAQLEARNVGKPITDARAEVGMVVDVFTYYAGAPERLFGKTIPVAGGVDMTFREPLGVVALIVPWNFPLAIASWKVAPALAAGNTVVLKPAGLTPLTAVELGKIALESGLPEGVLNVVVGAGRVVGERLVQHPDVAKVAFTGST